MCPLLESAPPSTTGATGATEVNFSRANLRIDAIAGDVAYVQRLLRMISTSDSKKSIRFSIDESIRLHDRSGASTLAPTLQNCADSSLLDDF